MNTEQLEAEEINTTPRIIVTASGFIVIPPKGAKLVIPKEQLLSVKDLIDFLQRHQQHTN